MKKIFLVLLVILLLLSSSCSDEREEATVRINFDSGLSRTLSPEEELLEVYGYTVIPIRPDGKEDKKRTSYYSYINISNLYVGHWKFKIYAFNKEKINIAYGEIDADLSSGKNTYNAKVKKLIGNGKMELTFTWDENYFGEGLLFSCEILTPEGTKKETSITKEKGKATLYSTLPSSSYILKSYLKDTNGDILSSIIEAVRITNEKTIRKTLTFPSVLVDDDNEEEDNEPSLFTNVPIKVKINGVGTLMEERKAFTASFTLLNDNLDKDKISKSWYLDGVEVGESNEINIQEGVLTSGIHTLSLLISNNNDGDLGSDCVIFKGVNSTEKGCVYETMKIENRGIHSIGENAVFTFLPNDDLIIVSNTYKTVEVVETDKNVGRIKHSYSFETFSLEENVEFVSSIGKESDGVYPVLFLCNTQSSCKAVLCAVNGKEGRIIMAGEDNNINAENNGAAPLRVFTSLINIGEYFVTTCESLDKSRLSFIYYSSSLSGNVLKGGKYDVALPTVEFGYTGIKCTSTLKGENCFLVSSSESVRAFSVGVVNQSPFREYIITRNLDGYMRDLTNSKFHLEYYSAISCGFLRGNGDELYIVAEDDDGEMKIFYFHLVDNFRYEVYKIESFLYTYIKTTNDGVFSYVLDKENRILYTYEVKGDKNGNALREKNALSLPFGDYNTMTLSESGRRILLYNNTKCKDILVLKVSS